MIAKARNIGRRVFRSMRKTPPVIRLAIVLAVAVSTVVVYNNLMVDRYTSAEYAPLLNTIAKGESRGNYNAYYGNAKNTAVRFTDMTITDVLAWQSDFIDQGHKSSAVGKYQIVRPTLRGLIAQLKIDPDKTRFDEQTQEKLAVALLERRGAREYMKGHLSREEFAANLAKEWAALPSISSTNPSESYYAGDGLNKVQISTDEVYTALATIKNGPHKK